MVACCSPSVKYTEETLNTLQYAYRAKNIRNCPVIQVDSTQRLVMQLRAEVDRLRAENAALRLDKGLPPAVIDHKPLLRPSPPTGDAPSPRGTASPRRSSSGRLAYSSRRSSEAGPRCVAQRPRGGVRWWGRGEGARHREGAGWLLGGLRRRGMGRFDSAVGYAEGYAAGLEQAREVVYSRGLDMTRPIEDYDLSRSMARSSGRLPPLTHSASGP